ncbi:MAG: TonB-dependent receptor [Burkholderiaceae bacterium]
MNNFVGDGNGYIGNLDLQPEKANTVSATFNWHAPDRRWGFEATPYYTRVDDYIDAQAWDPVANRPAASLAPNRFGVLRYVNQTARIQGLDLAGQCRWPRVLGGAGTSRDCSITRAERTWIQATVCTTPCRSTPG